LKKGFLISMGLGVAEEEATSVSSESTAPEIMNELLASKLKQPQWG